MDRLYGMLIAISSLRNTCFPSAHPQEDIRLNKAAEIVGKGSVVGFSQIFGCLVSF
jgi:hypothetical protein